MYGRFVDSKPEVSLGQPISGTVTTAYWGWVLAVELCASQGPCALAVPAEWCHRIWSRGQGRTLPKVPGRPSLRDRGPFTPLFCRVEGANSIRMVCSARGDAPHRPPVRPSAGSSASRSTATRTTFVSRRTVHPTLNGEKPVIRFEVLVPHLIERQRRLALVCEARLLGHGGVRRGRRARLPPAASRSRSAQDSSRFR